MAESTSPMHEDASRLEQAIEIYTAWRAAGGAKDPTRVIADHPELKELLEAMFGDRVAIETAADEGGRQVGDYTLLRELGRGGMGVVFEAVDRRLGRRVALKVLPAHLTLQPSAVARFKREALAAARLDHPNIVKVFDVGSDGDTHWFAMELIEGGSLAELRLPRLERAVTWIVMVAKALQHAHDAGILHRDLKPSNILLRPDGTPVLTDFGLAREVAMPSLTLTGGFLGTPNYVSPEQAEGRAVDARSDVFCLGATLYELITGTRPFDAKEPQQVLQRVLRDDPQDPRKLRAGLDADLAAVLLKALEKRRTARYQSAAELAADLGAWLQKRPVVARPVSQWTRTLRWVRREPMRAMVVCLVALAVPIIAGFAGYWISNASILAAGHQSLKEKELEVHLAEGFLMLGDEHFGKARVVFEEARQAAPESAEAILGICLSMLGSNEPGQALLLLDEALKRQADEVLSRARVQILLANGKHEDAVELEARLGPPEGASQWFLTGLRRYELARRTDDPALLRESVRCFDQAVRQARVARPVYHFRLAQAAVRADELVVAKQAADAIRVLWPDNQRGLEMIAAVLTDLDPEKAIPIYEQRAADESHPFRHTSYFNLGLNKKKVRDFDGAMTAFRMATVIKPDYARAYNEIGLLHQRRNEHQDALLSFDHAIRADPDFVKPYSNRGITLRRMGRQEEAALAYESALQRKPDYRQAHYNLGLVRRDQGRLEDAAACYRAAIAVDQDYLFAHGNLGEVLLELGSPDEAIVHFRKAIQLAPRDASPRAGLGKALAMLGDHAGSRRELELAMTLAPSNPEVLRALAWRLVDPALPEGQRDPLFGLIVARRALDVAGPDDIDARISLSEALLQTGDRAKAASLLEHLERDLRTHRSPSPLWSPRLATLRARVG